MKQKYPLLTVSFLALFLIIFGVEKPAKANVFDEAFGIISGYSRAFRFSRPRHYYKRRYKRRRYSRRRARRAARARRRYHRKIVRQQRARRRHSQRRLAQRKRAYAVALRRKKIVAARRARAMRLTASRNQRKLANLRLIKNRRAMNKRRAQNRLARSFTSPASKSVKRYSRANKKPSYAQVRIAQSKLRRNKPRKVIVAQAREGVKSSRSKNRRVAKAHIVEQARSELSYGRGDEASFLNGTEKKKVQRALSVAGFYRGAQDGMFGRRTRSAIRAYQRSLSQRRTGRLNHVQLASLLRAVNVSKNDSSDYLPQRERQVKKRALIRERAKALNEKLKAEAMAEKEKRVKSQKSVIRKIKKVPPILMKKVVVGKHNDRLKLEVKPIAKSVKPAPNERARSVMAAKVARKSLFSATSKPDFKGQAKKISNPIQQASLKRTHKGQSKPSRSVDYFHILTKTQQGENLWVVKCVHKQQLKLYYWRDQKWWVRGSKGGAIGHSEYGENGIQKLAKKVCTI